MCYGALCYFFYLFIYLIIIIKKKKEEEEQEAQKAFFSWDLGWFYEEIRTELVSADHLC